MAKPFVGRKIKGIIISSVMSKFSHQDEHGNDRQAIIRENTPHIRADHSESCFETGNVTESQEANQCHGKSHGYPEQEEDDEHEENPINSNDWSFHLFLSPRCSQSSQEINDECQGEDCESK